MAKETDEFKKILSKYKLTKFGEIDPFIIFNYSHDSKKTNIRNEYSAFKVLEHALNSIFRSQSISSSSSDNTTSPSAYVYDHFMFEDVIKVNDY